MAGNMCGIFGYYNHNVPQDTRKILGTLVHGLQRLEYRGYDSAGICIDVGTVSAGITPAQEFKPPRGVILKSQGNIKTLTNVADDYISEHSVDVSRVFDTHVAIAHTRWATHGPPSAKNAHPHSSDAHNEFVVVHNGIITNHAELRAWLIKQGETFVSETDTEVIPKLCRYVYKLLKGRSGSRGKKNGCVDDSPGFKPPLTPGHDDAIAVDSSEDDGHADGSQEDVVIPFPRLIMAVLQHLEGAYAILVRSSHYPGELVACKRGSPLIFGLGAREQDQDTGASNLAALHRTNARPSSFSCVSDSLNRDNWAQRPLECWVASDASAVIEHTKKVVVLEDGDVLHVCGGGWGIYNTGQSDIEQAVSRALQTLEMEVEHIMKSGYDHYMQKEIHEQPGSILETMRGRVPFEWRAPSSQADGSGDGNSSGGIGVQTAGCSVGTTPDTPPDQVKVGGLAPHIDLIRRSRRIVFVACGTSYHACLAARSTIEQLAGVAVVLELASDLLDRQCPIFRDDTCVFVSQSGETADTLQALSYAKSRGAFCVGITNTVGSAISRATDCGIHQNAGYEIGVASTKAYTSQIVCITMMAVALSADSAAKRHECARIVRELGELPNKIRAALRLDQQMRKLAEHVNELAKASNSLLFFGRGSNYATALEAALKMKEVALIHSEGILAGEMKHGPLALVDETLPIIVIATGDAMYAKMRSVVQQLLARSAQLVIVCDEGDEEMLSLSARDRGGATALIEVPKTCDALQPVLNIIPMQLLAYHLTVLRGLNVDQPRNLAKSVTVAD